MRRAVVYGVSIAVHLGLAGAVWSLKKPPRKERVAIVVREVKKAPPKPQAAEPPRPTPPEPPAPKAAPRKLAAARPQPAPAAPAPVAAGPAPAAAAPDFGLTLGGGAAGGVPVAAARPAAREEARPAKPKVLAARDEDEGCADEAVKPKPINVVQPTYTDDARAAQVEGKVRVEITVGPDGAVTDARVLAGLGHGLDEAAVEAARASTFEPGTRCGKPIAVTLKIGMHFSL